MKSSDFIGVCDISLFRLKPFVIEPLKALRGFLHIRKTTKATAFAVALVVAFLIKKVSCEILISNFFPAFEWSCKFFTDINLSLLCLKHCAGEVRCDRTMCAKTAGHSLP